MRYCHIISGMEAGHLVRNIWRHVNARRRRMLFWDIAVSNKEDLFARCLSQADVAGLGMSAGQTVGLAWVIRQGNSGSIHMTAWCDGATARIIGKMFLRKLAKLGYSSLLAVLPVPFRHIRRYVADIGFERAGVLPGGAPLAAWGRYADAELWVWKAGAVPPMPATFALVAYECEN